MITNAEICNELHSLPASKNASFREHQLEAVSNVVNNKKTLVIQKTGWGKSLVYFLSTRILKKHNKGMTIVVSPLLALISNQIEAARRFELEACSINSTNSKNQEEMEAINTRLANGEIDVLFVAPERFSNQNFMATTFEIIKDKIGLMVIDEVHCISDWGHDFRLDYMRLAEVVRFLPENTPLLGTTATANDRVIKDVASQMGDKVEIIRGNLTRDSLYIQVINLHDQASKLAWLAENINRLPKPGIVYCSTHGDCRFVKNWLLEHHVNAEAYFSDENEMPAEKRREIENAFNENSIDVLVATCAFGMGYDKPDIGFVIHFQKPGNIISYYQEIGRAARDIDNAYCILLAGDDDNSVQEYFMRNAFPDKKLILEIVNLLENANNGLKLTEIVNQTNKKGSEVEKALKFLIFYKDVYKEGSLYLRNSAQAELKIDFDHMEEVTERRRSELEIMNRYAELDSCYMQAATSLLNDAHSAPCGHCSNCAPERKLPESVSAVAVEEAQNFTRAVNYDMPIRKKWPVKVNGKATIPDNEKLAAGLILSNYGDCGWGHLVKEGKYPTDGSKPKFCDELVEAAADALKAKLEEWHITCLVAMPSCSQEHGDLVPDFTRRLSEKLQLPYEDAMYKEKDAPDQKLQNNSKTQYTNADKALQVKKHVSGNILLVDDMYDSGWSFTVAASKLVQAGADHVYGFALANTGTRG